MSSETLPAHPIKFLLEFSVFLLLLVPGIVWAGVKKLLPAKQKSVRGQVVLITGAARGIGRELALRFGKLGAKVACVDVDEMGIHDTVNMIKENGGEAADYKCDVSKRDQIKDMHAQVKKDLGLVDILINNAGIVWGHSYINPSKDQFITDLINVNLMGQFWMNREILPSMMERNSGHIVAMSSLSSMAGVGGISSYTASKWATNGMMECLENELRTMNLDVKMTTILPYFVKTNPKVSARLDIRFPELPTEFAGKLMIKGILEERRVFSVPGEMLTIIALVRLLPDNLQNLFNSIMYVKVIPEEEDEILIKKYTHIR